MHDQPCVYCTWGERATVAVAKTSIENDVGFVGNLPPLVREVEKGNTFEHRSTRPRKLAGCVGAVVTGNKLLRCEEDE